MFSTKSYTRFVAVVAITFASLAQPAYAAGSEQSQSVSQAQTSWLALVWAYGGAKWNAILNGKS